MVVEVLQHLTDSWMAIAECFRVLQPGGVGLILFHAIRVNLPEQWRPLFVLPFYRLIERMDQLLYNPKPSGPHYDALGWSLLARKPMIGSGSGRRAQA